MLSTVHHRAVDAVRREEAWRRRSREHDPDALVAEDIGATVVEELDHAAMRREIRAALDQLPAEQRQVLEMMYFEAKTQSMIAEELKLPLGTVKSRTLLGMRRLRDLVVKEGSS